MSDVGVCHNEAVAADDSLQSAVFGADIDRHAFTDCRVLRYEAQRLAVKLEVLWDAAYARKDGSPRLRPCCPVLDRGMPLDIHPGPILT